MRHPRHALARQRERRPKAACLPSVRRGFGPFFICAAPGAHVLHRESTLGVKKASLFWGESVVQRPRSRLMIARTKYDAKKQDDENR